MAEPPAATLHATWKAGDMLGKSALATGCRLIGVPAILADCCEKSRCRIVARAARGQWESAIAIDRDNDARKLYFLAQLSTLSLQATGARP